MGRMLRLSEPYHEGKEGIDNFDSGRIQNSHEIPMRLPNESFEGIDCQSIGSGASLCLTCQAEVQEAAALFDPQVVIVLSSLLGEGRTL